MQLDFAGITPDELSPRMMKVLTEFMDMMRNLQPGLESQSTNGMIRTEAIIKAHGLPEEYTRAIQVIIQVLRFGAEKLGSVDKRLLKEGLTFAIIEAVVFGYHLKASEDDFSTVAEAS